MESLRLGASPREAAEDALARVAEFFPSFQGALVVLSADGAGEAAPASGRSSRIGGPRLKSGLDRPRPPGAGSHAGAAYGWHFQYSARAAGDGEAAVVDVGATAAEALRRFDPRRGAGGAAGAARGAAQGGMVFGSEQEPGTAAALGEERAAGMMMGEEQEERRGGGVDGGSSSSAPSPVLQTDGRRGGEGRESVAVVVGVAAAGGVEEARRR